MKQLKRALALSCAVAFPCGVMAQVTVSDQEYVPHSTSMGRVSPVVTSASDTPAGLPIAIAGSVVPKSAKRHQLIKGFPIHVQLERWAKEAGWDFHWYPSISWKSIANADMSQHTDVSSAVEEVVQILRDEGKPVQLKISAANRVMEVISNEVRSIEE